MPTREEALQLVESLAQHGRELQALADGYVAARNLWIRALVDSGGLPRPVVAEVAGISVDRLAQVLQRERARGCPLPLVGLDHQE